MQLPKERKNCACNPRFNLKVKTGTEVNIKQKYRTEPCLELRTQNSELGDRSQHAKEREMTTIRRFCCNDLLRFASVNLDHLTETFNMSFYMTYLARWPDYFHVAEAPGNKVMGYIMGKVEGQGESWHGHVTAVTVATEFRRQQLAKKLMNLLEDISDKM
ncbi:unnamed protein product [Linum tenue]|uniref:N-acetyltransferase domain-containing protein n=1 Tax=Linum tenue TaxID=586396 RepID=A0AAV0ITH9_9ROSI|nr:unnamed protein product [Linum tenue]